MRKKKNNPWGWETEEEKRKRTMLVPSEEKMRLLQEFLEFSEKIRASNKINPSLSKK